MIGARFVRVSIFPLILVVCFVAGCVSAQRPPPAPSESFKTIGQKEFDVALQEYQKENYSQAIHVLMRLIDRYPGASILAEAQWMLAKSYEAQRDYGQALEEYQRFIKNYPDSDHLYEAKLRTDVLKQTVNPPSLPESRETIRAVQLESSSFANMEIFESTIQMLFKNGINSLIIPVTRTTDPLPGIYFKSDQAPVIEDFLGPILALAHDYKMSVFASIPLREMPWLKDTEWLDLEFDPGLRSVKSSQRLNLWNPSVQNYILALYLDLAVYPLDGLIIEEPVGYSEAEGFNEIALERFKNDFGLSPEPSRAGSQLMPAFWRWTGWKNRQVMTMLRHLLNELHTKQPKLRIGLAMSEDAIGFPKEALIKYGQDLLEANQAGFDFFIFSWESKTGKSEGSPAVLRLKDLIADQQKSILRIKLDDWSLRDYDFTNIADFSLAFKAAGNSFEWIQALPSGLVSPRPSP